MFNEPDAYHTALVLLQSTLFDSDTEKRNELLEFVFQRWKTQVKLESNNNDRV